MKRNKKDIKPLPDDIASLKEIIREERFKYRMMEEKLLILQSRFFARKTEKLSKEDDEQGRLFDEAEEWGDKASTEESQDKEEVQEEEIVIKEHSRKKKGRKPIPENLPREEVVHDLTDEEKQCACCNEKRPLLGEEVTEELDIIPAQIKVLKHVRKKYGPCKCAGSKENNEKPIIIASKPARIIPGSIASAGLLAYVLTNKFVDALPFYRQEKIFKRINVEVSRATMSNWTISTARACGDLIDLLWELVRESPLIQMDETTLQVINEPDKSINSKSYMWVTLGYLDGKKIVLFHYHSSRRKEVVSNLLKNYSGYLQTDGYAGYNEVGARPGMFHVGCFAHARRYFMDAKKVHKKKSSADMAISFIRDIYRIEKKLRAKLDEEEISSEDFVLQRRKEVEPVLEKFHKWLLKKVVEVVPGSLLGKAINYTLNEWNKLIRYLDLEILTPDNNRSENAIRPFVIGRKNWLFSNNPRGAHSSATIYSLIETAKANGLEPYRYLRYIFTKIPLAKSRDDLIKLLPMNLTPDDLYKV